MGHDLRHTLVELDDIGGVQTVGKLFTSTEETVLELLSSSKNTPPRALEQKKLSKSQARVALKKIQNYLGIVFVLSTAFGSYLLATDGSLWHLAISHAYGLIAISGVNLLLAVLSFSGVERAYLPGIVWAFLALLLQVGDIVTAPQYNMTIGHFASYLFELWSYDALIVAEILIIVIGLYGRTYLRTVTKKPVTYFNMGVSSSRRDFIQIVGAIGTLIGLTAILGVADVLTTPPALPQNTATNTLPSGVVANVNNLQVGVPVQFEYPAGYPNILFKNADGTLTALSMSCTHVCCPLQYIQQPKMLFCNCHGSEFDTNGNVIRGPAPLPLPKIELSVDAQGNITPTKVNGSSPCYA